MGLSEQETMLLVGLLEKIEWPLDPRVFRGILNKTVSVPIELAVLNAENEVLMFYRKDEDYEGNHMPGTVLRDNECVAGALDRLVHSEVVGGMVTPPVFVCVTEIHKGGGEDQNPTRHEISLIYACWMKGEYRGSGQFYRMIALPVDTLAHHRVLVEEVDKWLNKNMFP